MKIVTYNLRCVYDRDGINSFVHRAVALCDKIQSEKPEVIGFQEIVPKNLAVLEKLLPEYLFVGQFRNADYLGEGVFVALRKESCTLLGLETVWLSPTPYVAGSRFENQSKYPRICTAVKIRHIESGKIFRVFDLHLDHISEEARVLGIKAALKFVDSFADNAPKVILGDFNAEPDSEAIAMCNAREDISDVTDNIKVTFHGYGTTAIKIDYIYMEKELAEAVKKVEAWTDERNGVYLSDHYPVCAELEL